MKTLKSLPRAFWIVLLLAFMVRLIAAAAAPHPGIGDPAHYYSLARNLAEGRGFVIDHIWQYHNPPATVTHPIDYWMPLPAIWPAIALWIVPNSLFAALIPGVIFGTMIPALAYMIAGIAKAETNVRLMAMGLVMVLPEFVLNSARTDTTISYIVFAGGAMLCFYVGLREKPRYLLLAGIFAGLAQLSRQDGIILAPAMALSLLIHWRFGEKPIPWRWVLAIPIGWIGIMSPWLIRNWTLFGVPLPSGASRTLFMTSFIDQFSYGRTLDLQHYLGWGIPNILSNIAVMMLANVKTSYTLLDVGLPVMALVGIVGMIAKRDRERLLLIALPLITVFGLFVFYSALTPFHTQGGSFKKSYMLVIPFLAFAGAWALGAYVRPQRIAYLMAAAAAGFMLLNAFDLVRQDFDLAYRFNRDMRAFAAVVDELGDVNGDGEIIMMSQDPFMWAYMGYKALMIPSDPRDMILEAAYRYHVDYIMMPADRAALDPIYNGDETDPRLQLAGRYDVFAAYTVLPPDSD